MARLSGITSFLLILAGILGALRIVHVVTPMIHAPSDPRPFHSSDPRSAAERAGFDPWIPFYLPESLGAPPRVTVIRRPRPRISIEWIGTARLQLRQEPSTELGITPATARPLPGGRGDLWWQGPDMLHAVAQRGDVRIEIATDLSLQDLERVAATLRTAGRDDPAPGGPVKDPRAE